MKLPSPLIYCILLVLATRAVYGQQADSLKTRLTILDGRLQSHKLKDTDYLRSLDSLAPFLEQEDSLPEWLLKYRDIAFSDPKPGIFRARYYTYMALNAANTKKLGSAIYYSEKNNEERVNAGLFEKGGIPHSDMFAFFVYFGNRGYNQIIRKYQTLLPALQKMPAAAANGKVSQEQAYVALSIIQVAVFTYGEKNDTAHMDEAAQLARAILAAERRQPRLADAYRTLYDYLAYSIDFKTLAQRRPKEAGDLLYAAIGDIRDTSFPEHMRADYSTGLYSQAVDFYSGLHKTDSVRHYLQLLEGIGANARESTTDEAFVAANEGFLLGDEGKYADAWRQLKKAFELRDSAFYAVSADKEDNLYALAEADNAHAEMLRSQEKKRKVEQANLYLYFVISLLLVAGAALFVLNRERQRQRLLHLQINLARNFHDEIGPMLIYANALVKKELDDHPSERLSELKTHIGTIMNEVRGISHDLKSTQLGTIADLARENTTLLDKLKDATGTGYSLRAEDGDRSLSQIQYTHLLNIIRELIGNSIKHAEGKKIHLELKALGPNLVLQYSDDGTGMDPGAGSAGIGLENIRERVAGLQGVYQLNNSWPRGYSILISIPLL